MDISKYTRIDGTTHYIKISDILNDMEDGIISHIEQTRDKDKNAGEYPYNGCIDIVKEVFRDEK